MPSLQHDSSLRSFNTFGIDANASSYLEITSSDDLFQVFNNPELMSQPRLVIGGGSNLLLTPLLLAMGIDEVSVSPAAVPKVKKMLASIDSVTAQRMLHRAMCCDSGSEMKAFLTEELTKMKLDHLLLL